MTVYINEGFSLFQMVVVYLAHQHCSLTKPLSFFLKFFFCHCKDPLWNPVSHSVEALRTAQSHQHYK